MIFKNIKDDISDLLQDFAGEKKDEQTALKIKEAINKILKENNEFYSDIEVNYFNEKTAVVIILPDGQIDYIIK